MPGAWPGSRTPKLNQQSYARTNHKENEEWNCGYRVIKGLDTTQQKQVFVALRLAYLFKIGDDLSKQVSHPCSIILRFKVYLWF